MEDIAILLIATGAALFFGALRYTVLHQKPGMYPPKQLLRKKIGAFAGLGTIFLLIGWFLKQN